MAITQAMCTSFKVELLKGVHNFTNSSGDTFKLALYTSSATLGATTTVYTTSQEVSGTNYTAGGAALTNVTPTTSGTTAIVDFNDLTFSTATITARGCLIYNDDEGDKGEDDGDDRLSAFQGRPQVAEHLWQTQMRQAVTGE